MKTWHYVIILLVATFSVYLPSFGNKFVWDDEQFIYRNQFVQEFDIAKILTTNTIAGAGEISNYYRPVITLSFAIDKQIWGQNVIGYHLTNTLLHSLGGVMLFLLLLEIGFGKKTSFWVSLFFLLHPIQTEAVVYINSRGDSWYVLLAMLALYFLVRVINRKPITFHIYDSKFSFNLWVMAGFSSLFFLLSILSKETGIATFGLLVTTSLLILINQDQSKKINIRKLVKKQQIMLASLATSLLLAIVYLVGRLTFLNFSNSLNFYSDQDVYSSNLLVRLYTLSKVFFIYLRLLIVPYPLYMERHTNLVVNMISMWPLLFIIFNFGLAVLVWYEWYRQKTLIMFYGWSWFFIMLIPVSGLIPINGLLFEHWLYLPMVGMMLLLVGLLRLLPKKSYLLVSKWATPLLISIAIIYAALTIRQNYLWGDPIRFYSYLLQHTQSARIHNNYAMELGNKGKLNQALDEYQAAIDSGASYPQSYYNRGNTYRDLGDYDQAKMDYQQAISIDPSFYYAYNSLIALLVEQKEYEPALRVINLAETQFPGVIDYQLMKIQVLIELDQNDQAIELVDQLSAQISDPQVQRVMQKWREQATANLSQ